MLAQIKRAFAAVAMCGVVAVIGAIVIVVACQGDVAAHNTFLKVALASG